MSEIILIQIAAFLGALLFADAVYRMAVIPILDARARGRRLSGRDRAHRTAALLRRVEDAKGSILQGRLQSLLIGAGLSVLPSRFLSAQIGIILLAFAALRADTVTGLMLDLGAAFALGGIVPWLVLVLIRARRLYRFSEQLPEAIDTMVRSLKAGHPVPSAIQAIAEQMPAPIGPEFEVVADQMSLGAELPIALRALSERISNQDLAFLVVAVSIQHTSGGNLAEVLGNLSRVIRQRQAMMRKKHAITAEGRLSFWIITFMPIGFIGAMSVMNPDYFGDAWGHPLLNIALGISAVLQTICAIVVWRMVNFKV